MFLCTAFSCNQDDDRVNIDDVVEKYLTENDASAFATDASFTPSKEFISKTWAGEYAGYDEEQKGNTKIRRVLTLNGNGTYTNVLQGVILKDKSDYVDFEKESGTYTYDASNKTVTYTVTSDEVINYKTEKFDAYTAKHFRYENKPSYTEAATFSTVKEGKRGWITKDTYLQTLTDKKINLTFEMQEYTAK